MAGLPGSTAGRHDADADVVIAGAGAAGLSAWWHLRHHGPRLGRIVLVDRAIRPDLDHSWAFWGPDDAPFAHLADRAWDEVVVGWPGGTLRQAMPHGQRYHRIRRARFVDAVLAEVEADPGTEVVETEVTGIRDDLDAGIVETADGELAAPVVLQSLRLSPHDAARPVRHPIRQHFGGWEVTTEHPVFDPTAVTFMDLDTPQHDGLAFLYVLPEAPDRALVEHTLFSPTVRDDAFYDGHVGRYLDRIGAGDVVVRARERGAIPMEDRVPGQRWGAHVWNVGGVGGRIKPTTGYAFARIHAQTAHLARTWATTGAPQPLPEPRLLLRLADRLLLHVLHRRPADARPIFEQLFRTIPLDHLLAFLDEETRTLDDLRLMARMPWTPFLAAIAGEVAESAGERARRAT